MYNSLFFIYTWVGFLFRVFLLVRPSILGLLNGACPSNRGRSKGLCIGLETTKFIRPVSIPHFSPGYTSPGLAAGYNRGTLAGQTMSRGFTG